MSEPSSQPIQDNSEQQVLNALRGAFNYMAIRRLNSKEEAVFDQIRVAVTLLEERYDMNLRKPPLGVTPRWLVDEQRTAVLGEAISRYATQGMMRSNAESMQEWIEELMDITDRYTPLPSETRTIEFDGGRGKIVTQLNGDL